MNVDPSVEALAENFLRDLVSEVGREVIAGRHDEFRQRLAEAMQQAVEQEYGALVEELTA